MFSSTELTACNDNFIALQRGILQQQLATTESGATVEFD